MAAADQRASVARRYGFYGKRSRRSRRSRSRRSRSRRSRSRSRSRSRGGDQGRAEETEANAF
jgi:hypothetical protein